VSVVPRLLLLSGAEAAVLLRARLLLDVLAPREVGLTLVLRGLGSLLLTGGEPRSRLFWALLGRRMRFALFVLFVLFVVWLHFYLRLNWGWLTTG